MTVSASPRLKTLDALVQETARRLRALAEENHRLAAQAQRLDADNRRLQAQLKSLQGLSARHDRVKTKIEKLIQKLERAEATTAL